MKEVLMKQIKEALTHNPYVRDSDHRLVAWIWKIQMEDTISDSVLNLLNMGQLTNWETIARMRRKLQEENPDLRGSTWKERHTKAQEISHNESKIPDTL